MSKLIEISDKAVFVTPQISVKQVSPCKLEVSIGRAQYFTVTAPVGPLEVRSHWEYRDGPSEIVKNQYIEDYGPAAIQTYEAEKGIPWDRSRGFYSPIRIQLKDCHSIMLPRGFVVVAKFAETWGLKKIERLSAGDEIKILLEHEIEKGWHTIESISNLKR